MPLLEIVQTRQITATIRLDEPPPSRSTSMQPFSTPPPMRSWTRRWPTSSPRTATSRSSFGLRKPLVPLRAFVSAAHRRMARLESQWCSLQSPQEPVETASESRSRS
jgi:hypothetical protein